MGRWGIENGSKKNRVRGDFFEMQEMGALPFEA